MNNEEAGTEEQSSKKNIWNLVLGLIFLGYGSFRLYQKMEASDSDTFGMILAIAFIFFGIYDLYKYFTGK
ncbi:MAG: hypothetical protein R3214_01940 [Christiangramia sp.]|nr:hypothetical protein [Christiangramia sp.]